MSIKRTCILVVSCDRYQDLWTPFFTLFFRYWRDCPYPIYLCSNEASYQDVRLQTIHAGPDESWSSNLKRCLSQVPAENIILFQEDFLLTRMVDTAKIEFLVDYFRQRRAACLRLMPSPPPDRMNDGNPDVGEISKGAEYRVSLQTAIWDKGTLYSLLKEGESPWSFELIGSRRSDSINRPFLSISGTNRSSLPLDYFSTAIVQGKWVRQAVALCAREGISVDRKLRAIEPPMSPLNRKIFAHLRRIKRMVLPSPKPPDLGSERDR